MGLNTKKYFKNLLLVIELSSLSIDEFDENTYFSTGRYDRLYFLIKGQEISIKKYPEISYEINESGLYMISTTTSPERPYWPMLVSGDIDSIVDILSHMSEAEITRITSTVSLTKAKRFVEKN